MFSFIDACCAAPARAVLAVGRVGGPCGAALGCAVLLLAGCSHGAPPAAAQAFVRHGDSITIPDASPLRKRIVVAPVELRAAPHWLPVPGTVEADPAHVAQVRLAAAGRVRALDVELGQHVTRGELLAVIDSGDVAQAYADAEKARTALDLARKTLARVRAVATGGGAPMKDLQAAEAGYAQARADDRAAEARVTSLGGRAGAAGPRSVAIRAPIAGTVTALAIAPGTFVNDPTASILTIANIDRLWVTAQVPGNELGLVAAGQPAEIRVPAWPRRAFHGKVSSVGVELDPATRRIPVRIAIDNAGHALRPNMFAEVSLAVPRPAEPFVPASALLMDNDHTTVFVETSPWTFVRRVVDVGYNEGTDVRVLRGLAPGARVIVAGGVLLNDD